MSDTVTISTGTYDPFPSLTALNDPTTGQNGTLAFWANHSLDGLTDPTNVNSPPRSNSQVAIGNFLTGTCGPNAATVGSCPVGTFDGLPAMNMRPSQLGYYADGSMPISSFYFTRDSSSEVLSPELAYTANLQSFGWYVAGDPNQSTLMYASLDESLALPAAFNLAAIPLGTNYGFYATVNYGNGYVATYYTESQFNSFTQPMGAESFAALLGSDIVDGANKQHFALFDPAATDVIGLTGTVGNSGYQGMGDYQDAVLSMALATPEPSTLWMGILAVSGTLCVKRYFRRRL